MSGDLEPISPEKAVKPYLDSREDDAAENTIEGQDYRLRAFLAWCEEEGIGNMNSLDGRDLYAYRIWRREGHYDADEDEEPEELATITLRGDLATLRVFLRFCGSIDAVEEELCEQIPLPTLTDSDDVSDSTLDPDRISGILDYLETYQYASRQHISVLLLWHTGCRVGALRALDLDDLDLNGDRPNAKGPAIQFVHRPDEDTPLKKNEKSERWNTISAQVADAIEAYINGPRVDITDDYGRDPLITTSQGRVSNSAIRTTLYRVTRPCWYGEKCPHDRDPEECEATQEYKMSKCPSSRSPHDLRSGRVTAYRLQDVPRVVVSDRMDASGPVLDKHYDRRSRRQKAEQRRDHLPE